MRVEKALAALAAIYRETPQQAAIRLGIEGDFSHLQPADLGCRFQRALRKADNRRKSGRKRSVVLKNDLVESSAQVVEKHYKELSRELKKFIKTRIDYDVEDILQEVLFALCCVEYPPTLADAMRVGKTIARRQIAFKRYRLANSPATVTPQEDFYLLEEVYGWAEEEAPEADFAPTSDIEEAFRRAVAELVRFVGVKQAASAVGMREKTLRPVLGL